MATISKQTAKELIKKVRHKKNSHMYCILRYWDDVFDKESYAFCNNEVEYQAIVRSGIRDIKILWSSDRFQNPEKRKKQIAKAKKTEGLRKALGLL